jgi:dimethylargininase
MLPLTQLSSLLARTCTYRSYVTYAITRQVSPRLADAVASTRQPISLELARKQHDDYVLCLTRLLPAVKELPSSDDFPDCCFVEDTTVVINDTALMMNMGHESRRGEVKDMKEVIETLPGINRIVDMKSINDRARCDGGDVLFTSRHLFVGLSERTNQAGIQVLKEIFPKYEVIAVPVSGALHLKSLVTHMDSHTLVAPTGEIGDTLLSEMEAAERGYEVVRLPDILACNVVAVNGTIIAQDCPDSKGALQEAAEENNLAIEFVDTSELAKVDAALTCCSVLFDVK